MAEILTPTVSEKVSPDMFPQYLSEATKENLARIFENCPQGQAAFLGYAERFLRRYPEAVIALSRGRAFGGRGKAKRLEEKAEKDVQSGRLCSVKFGELLPMAGEHSLAVGMIAEILARTINIKEIKRVALAAAIHDHFKRDQLRRAHEAVQLLAEWGIDISRNDLPPDQHDIAVTVIHKAFDASQKEGDKALQALGIPDDIIMLSNMSTSSKVNEILKDPENHAALILFYLDHVFSVTTLKRITERLEGSRTANPVYGYHEADRISTPDGLVSGHDILLANDGKVANQIEQQVADLIGHNGDLKDLPAFIESLFVEAVLKDAQGA